MLRGFYICLNHDARNALLRGPSAPIGWVNYLQQSKCTWSEPSRGSLTLKSSNQRNKNVEDSAVRFEAKRSDPRPTLEKLGKRYEVGSCQRTCFMYG